MLKDQCDIESYVFDIYTYRVSNRAYVHNLGDKSSTAKMFSSTKAARNAIKGAYVVSVDGKPTFTMANVVGCFCRLQADEIELFEIVFAPEKRLTADEQRCVDNEHQWFKPDASPVQYIDAISTDESYNDTHNIPSISIADLRDIASIRYPDLNFSKESIPTDIVELAINAIRSDATTPEELSLGRFTRFKLKRLST